MVNEKIKEKSFEQKLHFSFLNSTFILFFFIVIIYFPLYKNKKRDLENLILMFLREPMDTCLACENIKSWKKNNFFPSLFLYIKKGPIQNIHIKKVGVRKPGVLFFSEHGFLNFHLEHFRTAEG